MHIQTKHRDRMKAAIRERVLRFRIVQLRDPTKICTVLDDRLERLARELENDALDVLKTPARKKPRGG